MRVSMLLAFCAVVGSASAQTVQMTATIDGKPAGSAVFSLSPGPNHGYLQQSTLKLSLDSKQLTLTESVKIGFDGTTQASESKEWVDGKLQRSYSITFDPHGATVKDGLSNSTSHVSIPAGAKTRDPAQLWFISIRPRVGSSMTATEFDENTLAWKSTTRTYVADVPVTLHGLKVTGHQIKDESNGHTVVSVLDDHGLPYEFEVETIKFTRK